MVYMLTCTPTLTSLTGFAYNRRKVELIGIDQTQKRLKFSDGQCCWSVNWRVYSRRQTAYSGDYCLETPVWAVFASEQMTLPVWE